MKKGSATTGKSLFIMQVCNGTMAMQCLYVIQDYFPALSFIAACAAARRAIGTRKGEQET